MSSCARSLRLCLFFLFVSGLWAWAETAIGTPESVAGEEVVASLDPYANETREEKDARMEWWRDAKFGLFIHWGVYSVPAGIYDGEKIGGIGEWIMLRGRIPVEEYKAFALLGNPKAGIPLSEGASISISTISPPPRSRKS